MPSEAVVIGLGALSVTGSPSLVALAAAAVAGGMAGDRIAYLLGRKASRRVTNAKAALAMAKAQQTLLRYGGIAILLGRFLPYGRTATAMTSGSVSMPLGRFRMFTALASAIWAVYAIGLGRLGGSTFTDSPLLGAAFGIVLGMLLASACAVVEKRRTAVAKRRAAAAERVAEVEAPERELVTAGPKATETRRGAAPAAAW
jgi:membrane protein DedA with SNARE-associated domain